MDKGVKVTKGGTECYQFFVPINNRLYFPSKHFNIHPYIIGAFLGDGCCMEQQLTISSENEEIPQRIADLLPVQYAAHIHKNSENNYNWSFALDNPRHSETGKMVTKLATKALFSEFEDEMCCDCHSKRIPERYFYGDRAERLALLQGLLDTDGYARNDNGRAEVSFSSVNLNLVQDVIRLVRELGFYTGKITQDNRSKKYKTGTCYSITISCEDSKKPELFCLKRKVQTLKDAISNKKKFHRYDRMPIVAIEKMPTKKEMVCIYVDNDEHLYLTNDCIVTHNTTLANIIANECGQQMKVCSGPAIKSVEDIVDILCELEENTLLYIDECHSLSKKVQEVLFFAMEQYVVDTSIDGMPMRQELPHFTLIGSTTDLDGLEEPCRNRFQLQVQLEDYEDDTMASIVRNAFKSINVECPEDCCEMIGRVSRSVPRNANSYCRRVYDTALVLNEGVITPEVVTDTFDLLGINEYGLNDLDMKYLKCLAENRKATGLETLAMMCGTTKGSIEKVVEPFLIKTGYIHKGPRGRSITTLGMEVYQECK